MKLLVAFFLLFSLPSVAFAQEQKIPFLKYEEVESVIKTHQDKILVVNFWSTTCAPCIKELPYFENVNTKFKDSPDFKMILISLDRPKDIEKVNKFLSSKNINTEVLILDDIKRMNTWIPKFQADWGGEIPVTLFYKKGEKVDFQNGEISEEELDKKITELLK